ncbi:MMPL family transporter [Streptomyces sp. YIM 98790]|uniref:MMPL family transporter n=1 Tax=Streptomyces sp. YIM 98790 TaxID=2689077 RepID=UPI00140A8EE4|nr:MMPL family transporter [Streptomyces sp. YIM 98790]
MKAVTRQNRPDPSRPADPGTGGERRVSRPPGRWRAVPWVLIALWAALLAVAGPAAGELESVQRDGVAEYLPASAESTQVAEIAQRLPGGGSTDVLLVWQRDGGLTPADRERADAVAAGVAADHGARGTPPGLPSADGTTLVHPLALTGLADETAETEAVADIRDRLARAAETAGDGLTAMAGGSGAVSADLEEVFSSVDATLTLATVAVVTVLLILIYRSPLLWLVPLISVGVAAAVSRAAVYGLVQVFGITVTAQSAGIMTVLVFGAGTDYALLLVARYREELRRHESTHLAMAGALRGTGPALLASSGTVAAGLLVLLVADQRSLSGFGPVAAVGVLCALAVMITLLPALLVLLGRRVFWPAIPVHGGEPPEGARRRWDLFGRMGGSVGRRPRTILTAGVLLLAVCSLGVSALPGQLKDRDSFTDTPESVTAMTLLAEKYPERSSRPITVMVPEESAGRIVERIRTAGGVADAERERTGEGWAEISVHADAPAESAAEEAVVAGLRTALQGTGALVGGPTAQQMDLAATGASDRARVIPLVLLAVLVILVVLLRSLLAPVLLLVAVAASWLASLGLGGFLFGPVFGFEGTDPSLAVITFVFGVALGVDYSIFLVTRMREENLRGLPTRRAALTALSRTGGVIASAGIVLAATFGVLMTLPLVFMIQVGFVVAAGVLLDTFLVRTYVVTAAAWLLDRRLWWPGPLSRETGGGGAHPAPEAREHAG